MTPISERQALALVEQGALLAPLDRAVRLTAALAGITQDEASELPLDTRDRVLIEGRRAMIGAALPFVMRCHVCSATMEGTLDCEDLLASEGEPDARIRAPNSRDVADAARGGDPALLAERCAPGLAIAPSELQARLERAFPLLESRVELECETCGAALAERFDIVRYFWSELERRAGQALDDVHVLAGAYGWSEGEVLALSTVRRRAYLARIAA